MGITFWADLRRSNTREDRLIALFNNEDEGITATSTKHLDCFPYYDVLVQYPSDKQITVELKYDQLAPKTKSVAIELDKRINSIIILSGLSATNADFYALSFLDDDSFYFLPVWLLEDMVEIHHKYFQSLIQVLNHQNSRFHTRGYLFSV